MIYTYGNEKLSDILSRRDTFIYTKDREVFSRYDDSVRIKTEYFLYVDDLHYYQITKTTYKQISKLFPDKVLRNNM